MRDKETSFEGCRRVVSSMSQAIVGKGECLRLLMVGLLAEGHVLLEDVPGLGKTLLAKALAQSLGGRFRRVQFTPDLLPSDITGFSVYNQKTGDFQIQSGPVMTNVLLADEINRTIPRTQSSLLEAMEERQVTIDGESLALPKPFFVIATQNPIELEGTYPLPEAQLDRFMLKLKLGYPERDEEIAILERFQTKDPLSSITAVLEPHQIVEAQAACRAVGVAAALRAYIADLVRATRSCEALELGASPRGALALMRAGQALAVLEGRDYVLPDDIKALAPSVLSHRLILADRERVRGTTARSIVDRILEATPVPTPLSS